MSSKQQSLANQNVMNLMQEPSKPSNSNRPFAMPESTPTLCGQCDAMLDDFLSKNSNINTGVEELIRQFKEEAKICKDCTFISAVSLEKFKDKIAEKKAAQLANAMSVENVVGAQVNPGDQVNPDNTDKMMTEEELAKLVFPDEMKPTEELNKLEVEKEEDSQKLENKQDTSEEELDGEKEEQLIEEFPLVKEPSIIDRLKSENVVHFPDIGDPNYKFSFYLMIQMPIILKELKNITLLINTRVDDTDIPPADKSIYTSYVKRVALDTTNLVSTYYTDTESYKGVLKDVLADVLSILEITQEISNYASQPSPSELPKSSAIPEMIKGKKKDLLLSPDIQRLIDAISSPESYPYVYKEAYILIINIKFLFDFLDKITGPTDNSQLVEIYKINFLVMNKAFKIEKPITDFVIDYMKLQDIPKCLDGTANPTINFFDKNLGESNARDIFAFFLGNMIPRLSSQGCQIFPISLESSIKTPFPSYIFIIKTQNPNLYYNTRDKIYFALRNLCVFLNTGYGINSCMMLEKITKDSFAFGSFFPKSLCIEDEELCFFADCYDSKTDIIIDTQIIFEILSGNSSTIESNFANIDRLTESAKKLLPYKAFNDFLVAIYKWKLDNTNKDNGLTVTVSPAVEILSPETLLSIKTANELEQLRYFLLYELPFSSEINLTYNGLIDIFTNILNKFDDIEIINWGGRVASLYFWSFKILKQVSFDCGFLKDRDLKLYTNNPKNQIFMMYVLEYLEAIKKIVSTSISPEIDCTIMDGTQFIITDDKKSVERMSSAAMAKRDIALSAITCEYTTTVKTGAVEGGMAVEGATNNIKFESVLDPLDVVSKSKILEKIFYEIDLPFLPEYKPFFIYESEVNKVVYATPLTFWVDITAMLLEPRAKSDKDCLRLFDFGIIILDRYFGIDINTQNKEAARASNASVKLLLDFFDRYFEPQITSYCSRNPVIPDISSSRIVQEIKSGTITYKDQLVAVTRGLIMDILKIPIEVINPKIQELINGFAALPGTCYSKTYNPNDPFTSGLYTFLAGKMRLVQELYEKTEEKTEGDFETAVDTLFDDTAEKLGVSLAIVDSIIAQFKINCGLSQAKQNKKFFIKGSKEEASGEEGMVLAGEGASGGPSGGSTTLHFSNEKRSKTRRNKKTVKKFIKTRRNKKSVKKNTRKNKKNRKIVRKSKKTE